MKRMVMMVLVWLIGRAAGGTVVSADEAQGRLKEGNARYAAGESAHPRTGPDRRAAIAAAQKPWATILSCSDSRVPPEYIFDQGFGDLFVIRVAGNVADTDEIATMEYGVGHVGTPLLVVLGHSRCGAVTAVAGGGELHGHLPDLLDNIRPALRKARENKPDASLDDVIDEAIALNVWQAIEDTFRRSEEVRRLAGEGRLKVVGALYDIESGVVSWMGGHPDQDGLLKAKAPAASGE